MLEIEPVLIACKASTLLVNTITQPLENILTESVSNLKISDLYSKLDILFVFESCLVVLWVFIDFVHQDFFQGA